MVIRFDPACLPENLQEMIQSASSLPGVSGLMILACGANGFTLARIDPILSRASIPVFGGVCPAIIYGRENEPLVGVYTIGEIVNCGAEFLEFYNKTAVVAMLEAG